VITIAVPKEAGSLNYADASRSTHDSDRNRFLRSLSCGRLGHYGGACLRSSEQRSIHSDRNELPSPQVLISPERLFGFCLDPIDPSVIGSYLHGRKNRANPISRHFVDRVKFRPALKTKLVILLVSLPQNLFYPLSLIGRKARFLSKHVDRLSVVCRR